MLRGDDGILREEAAVAGVAETISAEGLMLLKELEQRKDKDTP